MPQRSPRLFALVALGSWLLFGAASLWSGVPAAVPEELSKEAHALAGRHREFLDKVALLITPTEREVFLQLSEDYRRDSFVRRFWKERDPYPETARNEFLDRFQETYREAAERFPDLEDGRARFMMVHGAPGRTFRAHCQLLQPLEIWHYPQSPVLGHEFYAVFVRLGGRYRLWSPREGLHSIVLFSTALDRGAMAVEISQNCSRGDDILSAMAMTPDWEQLDSEGGLLPRPGDEWARSFLARSTEIPEGAALLRGSLRVDFTGRHQSRTVVEAMVELERAGLALGELGGRRSVNLVLDGEVVRGGELFESFRYKFALPLSGEDSELGGTVPVAIERNLRPGRYELVLRLQDLNSERYYKVRQAIDVPRWRPAGAAPPAPDSVTSLRQPEADEPEPEDAAPTAPAVRLRVPSEELITGRVRVEALAEGQGIAKVRFALNGRTIMTKNRAPFEVELDVGRAPRVHRLSATALDRENHELASDEISLNAGPNRFSVRLIEPQRGRVYSERVRAVAEVEVPRFDRLDRVEFYLNDVRVASLYQEPFSQPIDIPADQPLSYVRVLAVLEDGGAVEDVVFVNAPDQIDNLDVDFVELYTTVADGRGRIAEGLTASDFRVLEDGKEQSIKRFELVRDLPIHAGVLIDTSMSMLDRLTEAEQAALHFFNLVLSPQDRACLLTFNDSHELVVPFTSSPEVLAGGLAGLVAEGETALYDSLIHTFFYFNGLRGKRAVILLSDGADSSSRYRYEEVLDYARRSGVAFYSIGLEIDSRQMEVRAKLNRLCEETGGHCFFIDHTSELKKVYTRIERELRSQYLIAYQSTATGDSEEFREIKVKVLQSGLKARTLSGYYP